LSATTLLASKVSPASTLTKKPLAALDEEEAEEEVTSTMVTTTTSSEAHHDEGLVNPKVRAKTKGY
jgi:hypothetical protein